MRDVVDPAVAHLGDLLGDELPGLDEAAPLLDLPEMRPRLLGEPLGEVLNEPRPGRGIEHPPDMGFLQQQQLGVTGDPPREAGRDSRESAGDRDVERLDEHGVSTTDTRPESRQRGAQHVHPRVALGHHRQRRDGMHGRGAAVGFPDNLGNPRPKLACRTQLRNGHELIVVRGESKADLPQPIPNTKAAAAEQPQVGHPGGHAAGQLPRRTRTVVVERRAVNGDRADTAMSRVPATPSRQRRPRSGHDVR